MFSSSMVCGCPKCMGHSCSSASCLVETIMALVRSSISRAVSIYLASLGFRPSSCVATHVTRRLLRRTHCCVAMRKQQTYYRHQAASQCFQKAELHPLFLFLLARRWAPYCFQVTLLRTRRRCCNPAYTSATLSPECSRPSNCLGC